MSPAPRQHTPGPWHLNPRGWVVQSTGDIVTRLECSNNKDWDARLIASAPDLLNLLTAADRLEELTGENLAVYARTYAALARAAIAKATGGAA